MFTLIGWERREVKEAGGFVGTLESATKMPYLELATEASKVVILFDEAQDSYWDEGLWLEFFKALELGMGSTVDERLMRYLYLITDGHCGALLSLSEELYDVCLLLPMSMIVFGLQL